MKPTQDFLNAAEKHIRLTLQDLRPKLLEAHGVIEHQFKDDRTVVTEMDFLVERRLQAALHELDPKVGFSGEETGTDYDQQTFWLVDPIDGTESFIRGLPFSSNMIALIDNGQPIMSVIYNFFMDQYFLAIKGKGATMNGHSIHVSDRKLDRAFVVSTRGFVRSGLKGVNDRLFGMVRGMPQAHSAGFEYSSIARGAFDGGIFWRTSGKEWDMAPGALLVQEAGGRVENVGKSGYSFRDTDVLAANPVIFDDLMKFTLDEIAQLPS